MSSQRRAVTAHARLTPRCNNPSVRSIWCRCRLFFVTCSPVGGGIMARSRTSKADILRQIPTARANEMRGWKRGGRAVSGHCDRQTGRVMAQLTSGFVLGFPARSISQLAKASPALVAAVEVSPGGSGLHWEQLDVDLSVAGLLLSSIGRSEKVRELARFAGRVTSRAKATAARKNGAKGGRPRKATER